MRERKLTAALLLLVFTAACSADEGSADRARAAAPDTAGSAPAETAPVAPAAAEPAADTPVAVAQAATPDPAPATEEAASDDGFDPNRFQAGRHYTVITPAQPTSVGPDQVEVVEIFWYGCPHCYTLEPYAQRWKSTAKPEGAEFVRMPAALNPNWQGHARLFYTADALGMLEDVHNDIFREIHVNRNPLHTEERMVAFFTERGVSEADFLEAWNSFAVETNVKRSDSLVRRYRISGVPAIIVNGKYVTGADKAGGNEAVFEVVNFLVEKEQRRL